VKICEQDLAFAQPRTFLQLRFFDLDDQIGAEYRVDIANPRARSDVVCVLESNSHTGPALDGHLVASRGKFSRRRRRQPHSIFMDLDFFRYPDSHDLAPPAGQKMTRDD
jgi:hypothetical protein